MRLFALDGPYDEGREPGPGRGPGGPVRGAIDESRD